MHFLVDFIFSRSIIDIGVIFLHNRIKEVRNDNNLTQKEFAERIGLARGSIATIESGRAPAGPRTINDICEKFQINKQWLLTGEGKKHVEIETNELAFLIGQFAAENDEFKKRVITEMLKLDAHGWDVIHQLVHNIANKKD